MTNAALRLLSNNQNIRHRIFAVSITGNAIPINEKNAVRRGDTYQAGKERKSRKMDIRVITITNAFIVFFTIVGSELLFIITSIKKLALFFCA